MTALAASLPRTPALTKMLTDAPLFTKAGVLSGKTNAFKKAVVTLAEGDSIDFFSNI